MKTAYDELGVRPDADDRVIRTAYISAAKTYHPDLHCSDASTEEQFKRINAAHDMLKRPSQRAIYDKHLLRRRRRKRWMRSVRVAVYAAGCVVGASLVAGHAFVSRHWQSSEAAAMAPEAHAADQDGGITGHVADAGPPDLPAGTPDRDGTRPDASRRDNASAPRRLAVRNVDDTTARDEAHVMSIGRAIRFRIAHSATTTDPAATKAKGPRVHLDHEPPLAWLGDRAGLGNRAGLGDRAGAKPGALPPHLTDVTPLCGDETCRQRGAGRRRSRGPEMAWSVE